MSSWDETRHRRDRDGRFVTQPPTVPTEAVRQAREQARRVFFTSDLHLGHARIIELEPDRQELGGTIEEHDEELVRRWNETVTPDDHVWVLGDVLMGRTEQTAPVLGRLNGHKHLVRGNHDKWFTKKDSLGRARRFYQAYGFQAVYDGPVVVTVPDLGTVRLNHFPYRGVPDHEGYEERFEEFKQDNDGMLLLHGHTHQHHVVTGPNMLHVGVEAHGYRPVSSRNLARFLRPSG